MDIDPDDHVLARQLNDEGRTFQRNGDLKRARRYFMAARRIDPESELAKYNLATIDLLSGRVTRAARQFKRLVEDSPSSSIRADVSVRLGNIALDDNALEEAFAHYSRVLDIVIDDSHEDEKARVLGDGLLGMALVEKQRSNLSRALELFEQSVRADPLNVGGFFHLAHFHYQAGDYAKAIEYGKHAIELAKTLPNDPPTAEMWSFLGGYYEDAGRIAEAKECYQNALDLGDEDAREILQELADS